ncbi:MAG: hypothetical protein IH941_11845 [Acidobacteria bacterium]|nr:hypothetical protein [Acidobacteriota bacterium]
MSKTHSVFAAPPRVVWLTVFVLAELFLLRIATRTLIHIPGLGRFETPIRVLAEAGRLAYYAAVVFLVAVLVSMAYVRFKSPDPRSMLAGSAAVWFLLVAGTGRLGVVSVSVVGWSLSAALIVAVMAGWRGRRSVPLALFTLGVASAGWSVVGQGTGGGLTGRQVDTLLIIAEVALVLAGLTAPLLLEEPPIRRAVLIGLGAAAAVTAILWARPSTVWILGLWTLGVPGWLPGVVYALAFGGLVTTWCSAFGGGQWNIAIGLVLLTAGGVGAISTYQSGLVLVGVLLIGDVVSQTRSVPPLQTANQAAPMVLDNTQRSYSAVIATAWLISCSQTVFDHVPPKLLAVCASQSCSP